MRASMCRSNVRDLNKTDTHIIYIYIHTNIYTYANICMRKETDLAHDCALRCEIHNIIQIENRQDTYNIYIHKQIYMVNL